MGRRQKNIGQYDKIMRELDKILIEKRISYAQFSSKVGWQTVAFYNRYKVYGFEIVDMEHFLEVAKTLPPAKISCIKCGSKMLPKAKSVRRALCDSCREEIAKRKELDSLRYRYPDWVNVIKDINVRLLVEQEFHIDEVTAFEMAHARDVIHAKLIRAKRWDSAVGNVKISVAVMKSLISNIH